MNLAFGVVFIWVGAVMLYLATHGTQASTPWGAFQEALGAIGDGTTGNGGG